MKLIFAVVNGDDSQSVAKSLTKKGFFATKLASTGGFLSAGNTTFLNGIGTYTSFPVEVSVGGATIFITDVERFEKV